MKTYTQYSVEEYKTALVAIKPQMGEIHHQILQVQYNAQAHTITASELGHALNQRRPFINLQYGKLGRQIAEVLHKMPSQRQNGTYRWWSVLSTGQNSPTGFLWTMHLSLVQALEGLAWVKITNTASVNIPGKIRGLATFYINGIERQEIHIDKKFSDTLSCKNSERVNIDLKVGEQKYLAGVRVTDSNKYIWICPDLQDVQGNSIKLAEVLSKNGFVKNQKVFLSVLGKEIRILLPTNPIQEIEEYQLSYSNLPETERQAVVQSRIGQGYFRSKLIEYWTGCAITGCQETIVLKASHIKPWRKADNNERLDVYNGLLLTPNIDAVFDSGLITFSNTGRIIISLLLGDEDRQRLGIHPEMSLRKLDKEHIKYLEYHRRNIFKQK